MSPAEMLALLKGAGLAGLLDIFFMTLFIYAILVWFKRTKAAFVLTGIFIISGVYLIARAFNLLLIATVLQGFFTVILIAVVVIFQEELRHFFEQIAVWSFERKLPHRKRTAFSSREAEIITRTLADFAKERIGALIVIRGRDMIVRHLDGGVPLDGILSEELLRSIFDPHSVGHDGALVIEKSKVVQFSAHLPLSKDIAKIGRGGTRHAAALGLAELSDAMCLVVSEERGRISIARNGRIREIADPGELAAALEDFYRGHGPDDRSRPWRDFFVSNFFEKVAALCLTLVLWFVVVHGSDVIYRSYLVKVEHTEPDARWTVTEILPAEVRATFSGQRRAFYFFDEDEIRLRIKILNEKKGLKYCAISGSDLTFPAGLVLQNVEPASVRVRIDNKKAAVKAD